MTEVVAAFITGDDGRFLICRRPEGKARAHFWEFPGGKVEAGETKREALERECLEELGIRIEAGREIAEAVHEYPELTIRLTLISAKITAGEPSLLEHEELKWIAPGEAADHSFCPADTELLEKIC
jgi:8-oxo-dGTP diphosphatase